MKSAQNNQSWVQIVAADGLLLVAPFTNMD